MKTKNKLIFISITTMLLYFNSCSNHTGDNIHTVIFNSNGGSLVEPQHVKHGEKITKPNNPTRDDYIFDKWTYQGEEWSFVGYVVTTDMTLDANWTYAWSAPTYQWSFDYSSCTARRERIDDKNRFEEETKESTYEVITPATVDDDGVGRYTVNFDNPAFETQTHDVSIEKPLKSIITVVTLDKGPGSTWLYNAAEMFEELYKYSDEFEEGRMGVRVKIISSTSFDGSYVEYSPLAHDIYFTEGLANYRRLAQKENKFLDISDVVTDKLTTYNENKSIEDKMDKGMKDYLNVDGKYYGVPFYDSFIGMVYDISLWKEKGLYLSKDGSFVGADEDLSLGSDGIAGTLDDGLPSTYDEFKTLLYKLHNLSIIPFVFGQNSVEYTSSYLYNVLADYEGLKNMTLRNTLDGVATDLVNIDGLIINEDGSINSDSYIKDNPESMTITDCNGYMLGRQAGNYYALRFLYNTLSGSYEVEANHREACNVFVNGKQNGKPIGMIVEGSWWENETKSVIESYEERYGERSDYAIMPIPFVDDAKAEECGRRHTYVSHSESFGVVSSNCQNVKLAKEFLKFLHSDKMLSKFTVDTGMTRSLNYEILEEDQQQLSTYTKSLLDLKKNSDIFYPYASNQYMVDHGIKFSWRSLINELICVNPITFYASNNEYFDGLYRYLKSIWAS